MGAVKYGLLVDLYRFDLLVQVMKQSVVKVELGVKTTLEVVELLLRVLAEPKPAAVSSTIRHLDSVEIVDTSWRQAARG